METIVEQSGIPHPSFQECWSTSGKMQSIGRSLWQEFVKTVANDQRLAALRDACQLITFKFHDNYQSVHSVPDAECWLSAMHAVYRSNAAAVSQAFNHFKENCAPVAVFATCWGSENNTTNIGIVRNAWPDNAGEYHQNETYLPTGREYDISYPFMNTEPSAHNMNRVAYERGVIPAHWNIFWRLTDTAVVTWTLTESARHQAGRERREQEERRRSQERLRERQRQAEGARRREEQERQRQQQEEVRRHSEPAGVGSSQQSSNSQSSRGSSAGEERRRSQERLRERQRQAEGVRRREEQERQRQQQEEARRHPEPAGAGSSRNQRSGSRNSESSNTGASGGFGRRVLQRVRAWLNPPKA